MSSTLNWRTATALVLNDKLIPNPNAEHELLNRLRNVQVAIDAGFLHIDPRQSADRDAARGQEFTVTVVPAASVQTITYKETGRSGKLASF